MTRSLAVPATAGAAFFFDHATELMCVIGADGRFRSVNPAFQRLLGQGKDALCDRPYLDFVHPDDLPATRIAEDSLGTATPVATLENRYRARDGSWHWLKWRFGTRDEAGNILAIAQDITEDRRREAHARSIARSTGVGTWEVLHEDSRVIWSEETFRIHCRDPADGPPGVEAALAHYPPEARSILTAALTSLLSDGTPYDLELPFHTLDGRALWVRTTGAAERRDGKPIRAFGTFQDITDVRARRLHAERLGAAAEAATNAILLLDAHGRIEWANTAFERQSGHSLAEARGRSPGALAAASAPDAPLPHPERHAELAAALAAGRSTRVELPCRRRDGAVYWVDAGLQPMRHPDGTVSGFVLVETDITGARDHAARLAALESEARAARDRLIAAVEALPDGFVLYDRNDRIALCNTRFRELYPENAAAIRPGITFEEMARGGFRVGQIADAVGREEAWLAERMAQRRAGRVDRERRLNGGRILRVVERRTAEGEYVSFHVDITELRQEQQAAEAARRDLQATLDAFPDVLFEVAADGRILSARHGAAGRLHWPARAYHGLWLDHVLDEDSAERLCSRLAEAAATGRPPEGPILVSDEEHWFEVTVAPKTMPDGQPRFLLAARDITARVAAERQRAQKETELAAANAQLTRALAARDEAERRFADIAAISHDWFWEQDAELRFTFLSDTFRTATGVDPANLIGRRRAQVHGPRIPPDSAEVFADLDRRMAAHEVFRDIVYRFVTPDGGNLWIRISGAPFHDAQGRFAGYRGVGSDVTALHEARLRAEEASAAKSRFLANMSHEIRTPLNGIIGMAAVMEDGMRDAAQREMLEVIRGSGEMLVTILNDILDFSKIEAGLMQIETTSFSPGDLGRRVASLHRMRAAEKGLGFIVDVGCMPEAQRQGDGHRVLQVLHNLVSNAVKFTESGTVRVRFFCDDKHLQVEVQDTGIGMDPAQLGRVFDEFVQADSSVTRRYGGTGLGLSISRRLAELMGGALELHSQPGIGTTARLHLPAPPVTEDRTAAPAPAPEAAARPLQGLHALVADDNATNRLLMGKFLEKLGVSADIVECGEDAVTVAAGSACDVLLLDISMPDITGLEALARIRAADAAAGRPRRPAIAVTANAMHHQVHDYLTAGFDAHVGKPIRLEDLARGIEAVVPQLAMGGAPNP